MKTYRNIFRTSWNQFQVILPASRHTAWLASANSWREEDGDKQEIDGRWDLHNATLAWWHERELDTAYLSHGPWISIWRTSDEVSFRWTTWCNEDRGTQVFVVPHGRFTLRYADFESTAYGFFEDLLQAMRVRIEDIRHRTDLQNLVSVG